MASTRNTRANKGKAIMTTAIVGDEPVLTPSLPNNVMNDLNAPYRPQESDEGDEFYPNLTQEQFNGWQQAMDEEVKKRKSAEEELEYYKNMYESYAKQMDQTKDLLQRIKADERKVREVTRATKVEEVQANFRNPFLSIESGGMCRICITRGANVIMIPCRHVCLCSYCYNPSNKVCLLCDTYVIDTIHANRI